MITNIKFNNQGHDSFIDFIKTYAIIWVLVGHGLSIQWLWNIGYPIWGGGQVQLVILVQVFHCYKRNQKPINWPQIFKRILIPFFIMELFIIGAFSLVGHIKCNYFGEGPGSYYPWVYLQFAVILPTIRPIFERFDKYTILLVFLFISILGEILCSLFDVSEETYRLLCLRYLFLIPLGWLWVRDGVIINKVTILLSIISLLTIIWFAYGNFDNEPLFFNTNWYNCHWICYFFVAWLGIYILYIVWNRIKNNSVIYKISSILAYCSYEIFLVQMVLYTFYYPIMRMMLGNDDYVYSGTPLIMVLSVILGYKLKQLEDYFYKRCKSN